MALPEAVSVTGCARLLLVSLAGYALGRLTVRLLKRTLPREMARPRLRGALAFVVLLCPFLYWFTVEQTAGPRGGLSAVDSELLIALHLKFLRELILGLLLVVITVQDHYTLSCSAGLTDMGTLVGLGLAVLCPKTLPTTVNGSWLSLSYPAPWPEELGGYPNPHTLLFCLGVLVLWFPSQFVNWDRLTRLYIRNGSRLFIWSLSRHFCRAFRSHALQRYLLPTALLASASWWVSGERFQALLTALAGVCFGYLLGSLIGGLGAMLLRKQALGSGDVHLLGLAGAYVGWQGVLLIIVLSPFPGLAYAGLYARRRVLAFLPALSLCTFLVSLFWLHFEKLYRAWLALFA